MNVEFSKYNIQQKHIKDTRYIYDIVRRKWVVSTPEEQVRQMWLHYLHEGKRISISKIAVEKGFYINNKLRRFDICVFNNETQPYILIECKAPNQKLDKLVLEQLTRYNIILGAKIFVITNGINHIAFSIDKGIVDDIDQF
jgi:hypothetical protein